MEPIDESAICRASPPSLLRSEQRPASMPVERFAILADLLYNRHRPVAGVASCRTNEHAPDTVSWGRCRFPPSQPASPSFSVLRIWATTALSLYAPISPGAHPQPMILLACCLLLGSRTVGQEPSQSTARIPHNQFCRQHNPVHRCLRI